MAPGTYSRTRISKKQKFLVTLNYYGEIHNIFTKAKSEEDAKRNAIYRLANTLGIGFHPSTLFVYFNGDWDNFSVLKIVDNS